MGKSLSLGDVRAEHDKEMLDAAFLESADYRTLIESDAKSIVVGRRGTGKSALFWKLNNYYRAADKTDVITIAPDEHEMLALRPLADEFGGHFKLIRAAMRLAFRYGLLLEIADRLSTRFKFKESASAAVLLPKLGEWRGRGNFLSRIRAAVLRAIGGEENIESKIGCIADNLDLNKVENAIRESLQATKRSLVVLVDRTDEGYEPDEKGIGIADGLVQAVVELQDRIPGLRGVVFLRDNIYRAIAQYDEDFSRNLEQSVLRLHWDEVSLLNLAVNRIRIAFDITAEKSLRVWDSVTSDGLHGEVGFHYCLRLTLYRPRDLLLLLNEAFRRARTQSRRSIAATDITDSAVAISQSRLADLIKEYSSELPGIAELIAPFSHRDPQVSASEASDLIQNVISRDIYDQKIQQQFAIFKDSLDVVRGLYSVGFIGVRDRVSGNFMFCHDGRKPDKDVLLGEALLVHPCYWMALNLAQQVADGSAVSDIYDEYEVSVVSETPALRAKEMGQIESELRNIEIGEDGWSAFEQWCLRVVRVLFAGGLRNVQHNPNCVSLQRRDIVGTNHGATAFWKRVLKEYESRQVIFECKNFRDLGRENYWQMNSYLSRDYGRIGFFITRDDDAALRADKELSWVKELRDSHNKIVIKLPASYLVRLLGKIRNPTKYDAVDRALDNLLDTYIRSYFGERVTPRKQRQSEYKKETNRKR